MWNSIPSCLRRHKKKLLFLGGVVGGVAIMNTYLKRKFIEWEAQKTAEMNDQLQRYKHFEGTMTTCDTAFLNCVPQIRQVVCNNVDVNQVVKEVSSNPPNKIELWEELKILVFTQALVEMYAQCLLCILLRVQMSILSGYNIINRCTNSTAQEQKLKYMSRIEDFILNGITRLITRVKDAVTQTLQPVRLQHSFRLQDVEIFIHSIQKKVSDSESNLLQDMSSYLMTAAASSSASSDDDPQVQQDDFLERISKETIDVIECQDFSQVLQGCIDKGVSSLMDRLSECYGILSDGSEEFVNPNDFAAPFAKLIPIMHNVFCQHNPIEQGSLPHSLLQLEPLNNFAANIFEAFSQKAE